MNEQWEELKKTIVEIRDNNKFENEDLTLMCRFLINYMKILEADARAGDCFQPDSEERSTKQVYDAEFFDGKCPYTGKPCYEWECNSCEVEEQEKKYMEELDKAESEKHDHMTVDELVELFTEIEGKK